MDPDEYRNTKIRWVGYANAVGAALNQIIPYILRYTLQSISALYVGVDIAMSSRRVYESEREPEIAVIKAVDVFIFHLLATIIIPTLLADQLSTLISMIISIPLLPSAVPLCILPFIIEPVDKYITKMQDHTSRKLIAMIVKNYKNYDLDKIFTKAPE